MYVDEFANGSVLSVKVEELEDTPFIRTDICFVCVSMVATTTKGEPDATGTDAVPPSNLTTFNFDS
jgi:hypothetical protein